MGVLLVEPVYSLFCGLWTCTIHQGSPQKSGGGGG